jgi:hypothetical protein
MNSLLPIFSAVAVMSSTTVHAVELESFFGHRITIDGEFPYRSLKVDGRIVHKDAILTIMEALLVDGIPVLVGTSSNGGNSCAGTPFVISFPSSGLPHFDGPIDACYPVHYGVTARAIKFETDSIPGEGTERWIWTPQNGISELGTAKFAPVAGTGWSALRERTMDQPADVFKNAEISQDLRNLLGVRFSEFEDIIIGTGSGKFLADDFVATGCPSHQCDDQGAFIFLSAHDHKIYAAWKPVNQKIVVYPPVKMWTDKARLSLKGWASYWK